MADDQLQPRAPDASPERQAYANVTENGYTGRFVSNITNIRLFKDNPYIMDLSETTRTELNKDLLHPYPGELCYDDDLNIYIVQHKEDPVTGEVRFEYTSRTKSTMDKLQYYESKGVLNQLVSAYNNGQVHKFYYDLGRNMLFPNTNLVFPENYSYYTISRQYLNVNKQRIYVAGTIGDAGAVLDTHIGMRVVNDVAHNSKYTRMGSAKIFANSNPDAQHDVIVNGEFYVVDFYDKDGELIDTKLFQAVQAKVTNTQLPSSSVVRLRVTVFKNNIEASSDSNLYGIYAGEDLTKTTSFAVVAVYADGKEKLITDKLDTPILSREGWDANTTGAAVGEQFPVKFTYWSEIDEDGNPTGSKIEETIYFQIVENNYTKLAKVLPVIWSDTVTDLNVAHASTVAVYKLKVYAMSTDGIITNVTRAFYDTKKVVKTGTDVNTLVDFTACPVTYDPYQQCVIFTFTQNIVAEDTQFNFQVRSNGILQDLRFTALFGSGSGTGLYVRPLTMYTDTYGYGPEGLFEDLEFTYTYNNGNTGVKCNTATVTYEDSTASKLIKLELNNPDIYVRDQYARKINNMLIKPTKVQLFAVKDATMTPITAPVQINATATSVTLNTYKDDAVGTILNNNKTGNFLFAKFITEVNDAQTLIDIEVIKSVMNVIQ